MASATRNTAEPGGPMSPDSPCLHTASRACIGPTGRAAGSSGVVHPVDTGDPPVQAFHRIPAVLGHGRVLPHLRRGWHLAALTRRARPPPRSPRRITNAGVHPPAVRGPAHRRPGIAEPVRLRAGGNARPARLADLRGHRHEHRRSRRGAWSSGTGCAARAPRSCWWRCRQRSAGRSTGQ